jgi:FkbM family methyltransferase
MSFIKNILSGIKYRIKKAFYRPLSKFDISWIKEKTLKHQRDNKIKYHTYQNKYKIAFRNAEEFLISVDELFVKEFYKFNSSTEKPKIIDCGSYIGTSILYFKTIYPTASIIGFEPDENNYSLLKSNITSWGFTDIEIIRAAVWNENGNIIFNSIGGMSGSILLEQNDFSISQTSVPCKRLKDLLIEPIDFLKLDIEGAEYDVIKDCESQLFNVKNIFIEYHGYYDTLANLNEILKILIDNSFIYYIKEGLSLHERPYVEPASTKNFDILLNIFAFRL